MKIFHFFYFWGFEKLLRYYRLLLIVGLGYLVGYFRGFYLLRKICHFRACVILTLNGLHLSLPYILYFGSILETFGYHIAILATPECIG